ncbi:MAG: hypothetical protein HDT26_05760 [Subdoligranulum sp.]|nr:hypothetical protein [Subdoligranulum sp.]
MHDFHCREAKDIRNKVLARRMESIKNNEVEVAKMCEAMENYGDERYEEGREDGRISTIREFIEGGLPLEKVLSF